MSLFYSLFFVLPMGFEQDTMLVPPWLERLLHTPFFNVCRIHRDAARNECNMFCLDCNGDAFCFYCRSSRHKDHQVIQVRVLYICSYICSITYMILSYAHFNFPFAFLLSNSWVLIHVKAIGQWGWKFL